VRAGHRIRTEVLAIAIVWSSALSSESLVPINPIRAD
jgi:hypothetical protein